MTWQSVWKSRSSIGLKRNTFDELKQRVTHALVLVFPNFNEVFQVECDALGLGISGVLSQNQRSIAFLVKSSMKCAEIFYIWQGVLWNYSKFRVLASLLDNWWVYFLFWSRSTQIHPRAIKAQPSSCQIGWIFTSLFICHPTQGWDLKYRCWCSKSTTGARFRDEIRGLRLWYFLRIMLGWSRFQNYLE